MSLPSRQRSLRERIQSASRGIGISWQGKKSKSYHSKESLAEAQSSETDSDAIQKEEQKTEQTDKNNPIENSENNRKSSDSSVTRDEGSAGAEKKLLGRTLTQPQGTEQYKVADSETLAGIAARFDTTPSELAKLNRLAARIVFPGQLLFVPEKRNRGTESGEGHDTSDTLLPPQGDERRASVTDSLRIPYRRHSERTHRFLKVKARHFTDGQGVVAGVLIITPNAVMFDPNVSDPLVIEHGVESYGVIAPCDMLMRAAIYFDIAHMKVQHAAAETTPRPKAEVYFGKMTEEALAYEEEMRRDSSQEKAQFAPSVNEDTQNISPPLIKDIPTPSTTPVNETSPENSLPVENEVSSEPIIGPTAVDSVDSFDEEVSNAFAASEIQEKQQPSESRRERVLKRLSYPMESITSISRILTSSPKSFVDFSGSLFSGSVKGGSEEEEVKEEVCEEGAVEGGPSRYQNLVEEKPEIFEALDKLLSQRKPGEDTEGPPLYLCLRMGIPKERKPQPSPVLSYGKKRARSEYWFSIPRSRVEDLYNFLQQWIPSLYGDVDDVDPDEAGFIPIDDSAPDEEEEEEETEEKQSEDGGDKEAPRSFLKLVEEHFGFKSGISPGDWEVLSLGEMEKLDYSDLELPLPDLLAPSEIFQEDHIKELYTLLPARAVGYPWTRIYSTSSDGFHLKSLYRKMTEFDSPVILAIEDTDGAVFGALLSYPLRPSDSFYGTGESFLFTFHPAFKIFRWTGENDYFVKGNMDSISVGASEGHFGLWIDGDLYRGRSVRCQTYDNDTLASSSDFIIKTLEAWGFA
ncbi:oxidation resistance protein 1 isoform X2 [Parasteatoda tepidariorum]|uniref:oxidation resistance protein 1 isoform X2 n=1 Tax=Parasteatoda tepidariorum TaxID=114398 RepID=UPI001C7248EA|nr:oxidation resistance protein 1 isoform X2 [Parasteatoda tepidariorum]